MIGELQRLVMRVRVYFPKGPVVPKYGEGLSIAADNFAIKSKMLWVLRLQRKNLILHQIQETFVNQAASLAQRKGRPRPPFSFQISTHIPIIDALCT
jgi:hypothetical protein